MVLVGACGSESSGNTSSSVPTTTSATSTSVASAADFQRQTQALCLDIDERAYQRVQKVFPPGASPTPERRAEEARIRAEATDELVNGLKGLTPPSELAARWDAVLAGLDAYADHERALSAAVAAGNEEPERPEGLDNFRNLGLGGKCDDWLDMN